MEYSIVKKKYIPTMICKFCINPCIFKEHWTENNFPHQIFTYLSDKLKVRRALSFNHFSFTRFYLFFSRKLSFKTFEKYTRNKVKSISFSPSFMSLWIKFSLCSFSVWNYILNEHNHQGSYLANYQPCCRLIFILINDNWTYQYLRLIIIILKLKCIVFQVN